MGLYDIGRQYESTPHGYDKTAFSLEKGQA